MKKLRQDKWESLDEAGSIIERVTQLFGARPPKRSLRASPQPAFEINELENGYQVRADYPGIRREDVSVVFEGAILTVEANRRRVEAQGLGVPHCCEFAYGLSVRRFRIPSDADSSSADARLVDGVLTLNVGKSDTPEVDARPLSVSIAESFDDVREDRTA